MRGQENLEPAEEAYVTNGNPDRLREFAFFPFRVKYERGAAPRYSPLLAWNQTLNELATLAEDEDWGEATRSLDHPILNNYVNYTYKRLVTEDKIDVSADGQYAAFNTGLLTALSEELFALFERNHFRNDDAQDWFFKGWVTESNRDLLANFDPLPQMAQYVRTAGDLVYDCSCELKLAYSHILGDNIDRFPLDLQANPVRARQALDSAVNWALRKTRRNYKVVVPQWYPAAPEDTAQFLMPLDLDSDGRADLALVVSKANERIYRGHTVLTLEMAYSNARLVARPDSEWLLPSAGEPDEVD